MSYVQIKEYILEKFDLKVSMLYIIQIKKKCGILLMEHYNKSKKRNSLFHITQIKKKCEILLMEHYNKSKKEKQFIPQCTPEKEKAIMDALRHLKTI